MHPSDGTLDALLTVLAKHGVTDAEFAEDGSLKRVSMIPVAMAELGNPLAEDSATPETPADEAAHRMLRRNRSAA